MRKFCIAAVLTLLLAGPGAFVGPAGADQTDPRLDNLFLILQSSEERLEIRAAENLIWSTWIQHEDSDLNRLMQVGIKAMSDRRLDDAVEIFTALVDQAPDYAEAWNKRATIYFMQGRLAESAADVDRTLALEPRHFGALSGLGQIELIRGNGDAAIRAFEGALKVHPQLAGLRDLIGQIKRRVRGQEL